MAITLQELLVKVGADVSDYVQGMDTVISKAGDVGASLSNFGGLLSAGVTVPLAAIGTAAMEAAGQVKEATNAIIVQTGAMGDQLASLQGSFSAVFAGVPQSAKEVADSISQISVRLGLTGAPLEALSKQFLDLAHITGQQVQPLIESTAKAFQLWQVATANESGELDKLFSISQHTGASVTSLAQGLQEYGAKFQTMGLSFDQAAALLGTFEKAGVNATQVMTGLNKALSQMGQAGLDTSHGFEDIVNYIKMAATEADQLQRSIELFGAKAGTTVFQSIKSGALDMASLAKMAASTGDSIEKTAEKIKTFGTIMSEVWHQVELAIAPVGQIINSTLKDAVVTIGGDLVSALTNLSQAFQGLPEGVQKTIVGLGALAAAAGPALLAIGAIGPMISSGIGAGIASVEGLGAAFAALAANPIALALLGGTAVIAIAYTQLEGATASLHKLDDEFSKWIATQVTGAKTAKDLESAQANVNKAFENGLITKQQDLKLLQQIDDAQKKLLGQDVTKLEGSLGIPSLTIAKPQPTETEQQRAQRLGDALKASKEAAKQLAEALEQVGLAGLHTEKVVAAMDLVTKAFESGKLSAQQFGTAIDTVINKQLAAAEKLQQSAIPVNLDKSALESFKSQLDALNAAYAKGRVSLDDYVSGMKDLDAAFNQANGTSLEDALMHLNIPTHKVLADAAADMQHYYQIVEQSGLASVDQVNKAWQEMFQAQQKVDPRLNALAGLNIMSQDQLDHSLDATRKYFLQLVAAGNGTYAELTKGADEWFDAWLKDLAGLVPFYTALKNLNITPSEKLTKNFTDTLRDYKIVADDALATFAQVDQAAQTAFSAWLKLQQGTDNRMYSLKALGIPSQEELLNAAVQTEAYYSKIVQSAVSSYGEIDAARQKALGTANALAQNLDPAQAALKAMNIPSQEILDQAAAAAKQYYEDIRNSQAGFITVFQGNDTEWEQATVKTMQRTAAEVEAARQTMEKAAAAAADNQNGLTSAYRLFGLSGPDDLNKVVNQLRDAYTSVKNSGTQTVTTLDAMWQKLYAEELKTNQTLSAEKFLGIPSDQEIQHTISTVQAAYKTLVAAYEDGQISQFTLEKAQLAELQKVVQEQQQAGIAMSLDQGRQLQLLSDQIAKANLNVWGSIHTEVKSVVDTLDTGLANAVLDLPNFGKDMVKTLTQIEGQVVTAVFKTLTKPLTDELTKVLTDALAPIGQSIAKFLGFLPTGGGLAQGVYGNLPTAYNAFQDTSLIPGYGAAAASAGSAGANAASPVAAASSASSSLGSLGGIASVAGIVNTGVSIVSGIVQGIQMSRLENLTGEIEVTSRGILNEALNFRKDQWQQHGEILQKMDEAYQMIASGFEDQFQRLGDIWQTLLGGAAPSDSSATGDSRGIKGHGSTNTQPSAMPVYANGQIVNPQVPRGVTTDTTDYMAQYNAAQQALAESSAAAATSIASMTGAVTQATAVIPTIAQSSTAAANSIASLAGAMAQATVPIASISSFPSFGADEQMAIAAAIGNAITSVMSGPQVIGAFSRGDLQKQVADAVASVVGPLSKAQIDAIIGAVDTTIQNTKIWDLNTRVSDIENAAIAALSKASIPMVSSAVAGAPFDPSSILQSLSVAASGNAALATMATAVSAASQASTSIPGNGRATDTLPVYGGIVTAGTAASDALNAVSDAASGMTSAITTSAVHVATLGDLMQAVISTVDASPVVTSLAQAGAPSFTSPFDMFSSPFPVTPDVTDIPPHSSAQAPGGGTWEGGHFYADKNPDPWTAIMANINAQGNWMPPAASGPPMPALATGGNNSRVTNVIFNAPISFRNRSDVDYMLGLTLNKLG